MIRPIQPNESSPVAFLSDSFALTDRQSESAFPGRIMSTLFCSCCKTYKIRNYTFYSMIDRRANNVQRGMNSQILGCQ